MAKYFGKSKTELDRLNRKQLVELITEAGEVTTDTIILTEINDKLERIMNEFSEFKMAAQARFEKLEGEVSFVKNANALLKKEVEKCNSEERFVNLEREAHRTAEYVNYDSIEFSKIPLAIPDDELTDVILKIMNSLRTESKLKPIQPVHLQACHRRQGDFTRENVLVKMVLRSDAHFFVSHGKDLRDKLLTDIDARLTKPIYINEHLTPYYSQLRYRCKLLWQAKMIHGYLVSGHKVKVCMVTNDPY